MKNTFASALLLTGASAFPFVAQQQGVDNRLLSRQQPAPAGQAGSAATCPFNANHKPANPVTAQYPYNNAKGGRKGNEKGGYLVPHPNDAAHAFVAPNTQTDIRGPCPGLNAAANHNFLAHDGITTFNELVDAQQNVYNVGYDLAMLLAVLGLTLTDGDVVTMKLSIGCDATTRTSYNPALTGSEPGLDGHNKFEADTSLTRNDFFTHNGDNYNFNGTLFGMMDQTCNSNFDLPGLSKYRLQRYQQSRAENPNFYFGPLSLLLFGAASFLYELMPSGTHGYRPDLETISTFFGTNKDANGNWVYTAERIPANWTNRVPPYTNNDVTSQILQMYAMNPVAFGGNAGGVFVGTPDFGSIQNGTLNTNLSPTAASCLLYQLATGNIPSYANSVITPTVEAASFALTQLSKTSFANLGCPIALT